MSKAGQRIGLFGGTFDPIHLGHLAVAQQAAESLDLSRVWFIPSGRPPHKKRARMTPSGLRHRMVKLALAGNPRFRASDIELRPSGAAYTIDSLRKIRAAHPGAELYLLMGMDQASTLSDWKEPERILEICRVAVLTRPGFQASQVEPRWRKKLIFLPVSRLEISASEIRSRVRRGQSIKYLVPSAVEEMIRRYRLYSGNDDPGQKAAGGTKKT
jgi:nicotinate-nucleotide adenylyltransferase